MKTDPQDLIFTSQGFRLNGTLHLPGRKNPPLVIGSHGLEGSKNSAKQVVLSRLLTQNGMAFLRFDHRGCGESQGDFIKDTSLEKRTIDLVNAIRHVLGLGRTSRKIALFGSSMGGATCINTWKRLQTFDVTLCGAVLCAAPLKSRTIINIPTHATASRPALPLTFFTKNLLFDLSEKAKDLSHVLIFHGDADEVVPVDNAHRLFAKVKDPRQLIIQKGGAHQMTIPEHQAEFEKKAPAWFLECFR